MNKFLKLLIEQGSISRDLASKIDTSLDGALFLEIPKNSYTQNPSTVNFKETLDIIKSHMLSDNSVRNTKDNYVDLIIKLEDAKTKFDFIMNKSIFLKNTKFINEDALIVIGDDTKVLRDILIKDTELIKSQLLDYYGDEIEFQLNKLIGSITYEYINGNTTYGSIMDIIKSFRNFGVVGYWESELLEHADEEYIPEYITNDIEYYSSPTILSAMELLIVFLNINLDKDIKGRTYGKIQDTEFKLKD